MALDRVPEYVLFDQVWVDDELLDGPVRCPRSPSTSIWHGSPAEVLHRLTAGGDAQAEAPRRALIDRLDGALRPAVVRVLLDLPLADRRSAARARARVIVRQPLRPLRPLSTRNGHAGQVSAPRQEKRPRASYFSVGQGEAPADRSYECPRDAGKECP